MLPLTEKEYEICDMVLNHLQSQTNYVELGGYYSNRHPGGHPEMKEILRVNRFLIEEKFVELKNDTTDNVIITSKGIDAVKLGGIYEYDQYEIQMSMPDFEKQEKERKMFENEYKVKKWQVQAFWPLMIISVLGGALGLISFLNSIFHWY